MMAEPQKKYYRQRAHSNPMADHCFDYPLSPDLMDWSTCYVNGTPPVMLDMGCGYGGLLVTLSPLFPHHNILGIEIRVKVCDYVKDRIMALRNQAQGQNIACIRSNAMKFLPNFFAKGSIEKMFFLFPDPHFKKQKHKWRIISQQLLAEYAYVLKVNGKVYIATDVQDLFHWMTDHFSQHPLFIRDQNEDSDPVLPLLFDSTEEGKKVTRTGGHKFAAIFVRIASQ